MKTFVLLVLTAFNKLLFHAHFLRCTVKRILPGKLAEILDTSCSCTHYHVLHFTNNKSM